MTPASYVLHNGRTYAVAALVKQNGLPHVCIMVAPGKLLLVPLAVAQAAPARSAPRLVTVDGEKI